MIQLWRTLKYYWLMRRLGIQLLRAGEAIDAWVREVEAANG